MNPHRASLSRHPLAQLSLAFAAGICAANYLPLRFSFVVIGGLLCALAAMVGVLRRRLVVAGVALLVATAFAGAMLAVIEKRAGEGGSFVGETVLTGVLIGPPVYGRDRAYLTLSVERTDLGHGFSQIVSLVAPYRTATSKQEYRQLRLTYGSRIRVAARLSRTDNYANPGVSPLSEYLERRGYDATGVIKSAAAIVKLEGSEGAVGVRAREFSLLAWLYWWREALQREIDEKFAPETAGVLDAALLGNRYNLSRDTAERFREGGTFHVLVISGLHISFIGGLVFLLTKRLTRRRLVQFLLPTIIVWCYALAVGAESSVVRAALMFTFAGLALVIFRDSTSLNALGGAALVLLVLRPQEIFDPSFQLTFLSVLAIVAIAWPLLQTFAGIGAWYPSRETPVPPDCSRGLRSFCEVLFWSERKWRKEIARSSHRYRLFKSPLALWLERRRVQFILRYAFASIVVSAAVQLVLLPLMIVYFHRLSPASLVLNIVVGVLLTVLCVVALFALLVSQMSLSLAAPLFAFADKINTLMVHSVDPFAQLNLASIRLPEYSGWGVLVYVVYYVPLLVIAIALARCRPLALSVQSSRRWMLPAGLAQALFFAVVVWHPFSASGSDGRLRVDFLDVGQGDAALVTLPDGRTLLVDGGGTTDKHGLNTDRRSIGEAVVSEYLWWRGLDTVDYVLATHADADHIDGLNDVLRNFTVNAALVARSPANDPEYAKFAQRVSATRTQLVKIRGGDVVRFGDVIIHVLWPPVATDANEPSRNNDSTVLRLLFGERSMLLTGDIEKSAERALLASRNELHADVVKVPHHGSKSSSTQPFVSATRAQFAIVSVGQDSMFGHPHREVVERWDASGACVLTTGTCGTITVTTNGTDLSVTAMRLKSENRLAYKGPPADYPPCKF
ncbi:MAG TPA: ComEC/Rec2 family competence protein [Pyrinomonadaceae bacterium]|nr:ComEC/Rec2 family competence protein [Pyrinomonadaceae bacterium]